MLPHEQSAYQPQSAHQSTQHNSGTIGLQNIGNLLLAPASISHQQASWSVAARVPASEHSPGLGSCRFLVVCLPAAASFDYSFRGLLAVQLKSGLKLCVLALLQTAASLSSEVAPMIVDSRQDMTCCVNCKRCDCRNVQDTHEQKLGCCTGCGMSGPIIVMCSINTDLCHAMPCL